MSIYLIFTVLSIAFLEILLSIDNAIVIGLLAREAGPKDQKKILFYGFLGAFVLRGVMLLIVSWLTKIFWLKLAGGLYLIFIAVAHFYEDEKIQEEKIRHQSFSKTLTKIIFIDLVFAVDSVLAVVALAKQLWVIFGGVAVGMVAIRFIANAVSQLVNRFPRLETTGYALVGLVGTRMSLEAVNEHYLHIPSIAFHSPQSFSFWIFWVLFISLCAMPFLSRKK